MGQGVRATDSTIHGEGSKNSSTIFINPKERGLMFDSSSKAYKEIDKLTKNITAELNQSVASIVFHDAYQYFEKRFGVEALGALTINTDVQPGAKQIAEIQELVENNSKME